MAFRDIKGQGSAVGLLEKSIASGRLAHSYLFHGPEGVGKELAARNFAKVLNCVAPICGDACERCENCLRAEKGTHPDLLWLRPEGKVRVIKIDTIREFQHSIAMRPYMGRWKVGIFVDAHTLQHREEAAHALLKTLEEPPAHTILILVTARPELLLPTIISRCQSVRFSAMPVKDLAPLLEKRHALSEREAADLARLTGGRLGEAVRSIREGRLELARRVAKLLGAGGGGYWGGAAGVLGALGESLIHTEEALEWELAERGLRPAAGEPEDEEIEERRKAFVEGEIRRRQEELLADLLNWYRDCLVWKRTGSADLLLSAARSEEIAGAAARIGEVEIEACIRRLEEASGALRMNADFLTVIESVLVQTSTKE